MGCIYLLYDDEGKCYVGKSCDLQKRLIQHKYKYNRTRSRYLNEDFKCDVIVECDDEDELAKLEQTYFDYYKDLFGEKCVNCIRPLQSRKEHYETHKEQNNQKITCECGSVVRYGKKARHAKTNKHQNYLRNLPT